MAAAAHAVPPSSSAPVRSADRAPVYSRLMPSMRHARLLLALCLVVPLVGCAEPPAKELSQAQGAIDAARAAGAAEYAVEEFTAASDTLARAHQAVTERDYRAALEPCARQQRPGAGGGQVGGRRPRQGPAGRREDDCGDHGSHHRKCKPVWPLAKPGACQRQHAGARSSRRGGGRGGGLRAGRRREGRIVGHRRPARPHDGVDRGGQDAGPAAATGQDPSALSGPGRRIRTPSARDSSQIPRVLRRAATGGARWRRTESLPSPSGTRPRGSTPPAGCRPATSPRRHERRRRRPSR